MAYSLPRSPCSYSTTFPYDPCPRRRTLAYPLMALRPSRPFEASTWGVVGTGRGWRSEGGERAEPGQCEREHSSAEALTAGGLAKGDAEASERRRVSVDNASETQEGGGLGKTTRKKARESKAKAHRRVREVHGPGAERLGARGVVPAAAEGARVAERAAVAAEEGAGVTALRGGAGNGGVGEVSRSDSIGS